MPEIKSKVGISDKIHIVLTGPDGKIKDERGKESCYKKRIRSFIARLVSRG